VLTFGEGFLVPHHSTHNTEERGREGEMGIRERKRGLRGKES
jgi:hypothetical protein